MMAALQNGYVETLMEAGAVFATPGCGPCMGNHLGVPAPGETTISTRTATFPVAWARATPKSIWPALR